MWEIIVRAGLKYISRAVGVLDDLEFVYGLRRSREIVAFARKPVDASLDVDGLDMQRVVLVGVQRIGLWSRSNMPPWGSIVAVLIFRG